MRIARNQPLHPLCTLGVGGAAEHYAEARSEADVVEAAGYARDRGLDLIVLGGGSNVVIADGGLGGLVLKMAISGISAAVSGSRVELGAGAGEAWDHLVAYSVEHDWAGLECLSGIPGQVGATPMQNVGAYGQEVSETIQRVRAFDRRTAEIVELNGEDCRFAYRNSVFKRDEPNRYVIVQVLYRLRAGGAPSVKYAELEASLAEHPKPTLKQVRAAVLSLRERKSMLAATSDPNARSCGSFFLNPLVDAERLAAIARLTHPLEPPHFEQPDGRFKLPAAWLIERAGFHKGLRSGNVGLSTRHTLAIVCHDGARARDVVGLAHEIRRAVAERFEVRLIPEPQFLGFEGDDGGLPPLDG